ncbi:fission ELM1 [Marinobacterium lutimaris]|uniref:Fission ELM1 n=2 Tax=Marinobacterium lutimaris TaxID=568106 RepID=A0A1H6DAZ0_9GAMM|nr:fission ELM1 [Marinobacterium lutimaris]
MRGHIPVVNDSDVIVLKTPPFEYVALLLAAGSKAKLFYIGSPKRVKSERFGELISTPSTPCASATVMLDMLPTEKSYAEYRERSEVFQGSRYALLLLGGDAKGYHYQSDDWVKISNFVNNYSDITGIKWVVSTSPRTGIDAEKILKSQIDKNACECFVCWGDGDRKTVFDCLTGACEVFVTHDSASMISEAINVRLPTIVIRPDKTEYNSLTVPLVDHMVSKRAAMDIKCSDLSLESVGEWKNKEFKPINKCWVEAWERGD